MANPARRAATEIRLRRELNDALRERNTARNEVEAGRQVISAQGEQINLLQINVGHYANEYAEADAAHRAALADLAEAYRELAAARLDLFNERAHVPVFVEPDGDSSE
ncbi:hypothetical protein I5H08_gp053 [Mycobacterium phage Yuna]|uniref:Uncharacterized protein n=1 Tax=Mycobacterium phage Yuna TaxID=2599885 RepID=A0A5J6TH50_9CAUD|nr:hypothetical protein I5H08_gp053 [Mycobacterium phage Yuna]QFG09434.1 hypothetical protein PBI_YUNA_52 [Mycobacterium phage Yuna]